MECPTAGATEVATTNPSIDPLIATEVATTLFVVTTLAVALEIATKAAITLYCSHDFSRGS